jgi:hypothetical protein
MKRIIHRFLTILSLGLPNVFMTSGRLTGVGGNPSEETTSGSPDFEMGQKIGKVKSLIENKKYEEAREKLKNLTREAGQLFSPSTSIPKYIKDEIDKLKLKLEELLGLD